VTAAVPVGPSAVRGGDQLRAAAVAAFRLAALAGAPDRWRHGGLLVATAAVAAVESVVLVAACVAAGRVRAWWLACDGPLLAVLLLVSGWPGISGADGGFSPLYNFTTPAVIGLGLAPWPLGAALGTSATVAAANLATAVASHHAAYPLWNAVPDSAVFLGNTTIAWVVAWTLREYDRALDAERDTAVRHADALAAAREQARIGQALESTVLATLTDLVTAERVVPPTLRRQVRHELAWLTAVISDGVVDGEPALLAGLRALAAEKRATGLRTHLGLPAAEPCLAPDRIAALLDAAREALTNVAKHAGTDHAAISVTSGPDAVTVAVCDAGRGYRPGAPSAGTGVNLSIRRRMGDAGGGAAIDSRPGRGTVVRLWVPAGVPARRP
jgi:signal transduction histidine kinase